ncbi:MAG: LegC family aminotransferase [Oligoflexia bacterium]|nr:LegC family aminotransferase [Oligoflexia bacterium]
MSDFIPLCVPSFNGNEAKYLKECVDTGWVSSAGRFVTQFENDIIAYTGCKYAVACVNGTSALHVSLVVSGVEPEDEVIVPTLTFIAPVNAVKYAGANPVFMDCDDYYNIDPAKTIDFLKNNTVQKNGNCFNKNSGKRIAAIIPVHVFGSAVNMEPLIDILSEKNITVIEDATESLGTFYTSGKLKGRHTGTIANIGCYSFNGNKIITTGGGGMVVTNDKTTADRIRYLTTQAKNDDFMYRHDSVGYNYRMTNIAAALGVAQLEEIDSIIARRKLIFNYYNDAFRNNDLFEIADPPGYCNSNHWLFALKSRGNSTIEDMVSLIRHLENHKIQARPLWMLNHLQKPYSCYESYKIEKATGLYNKTVNIPSSYDLTMENVNYIARIVSQWKK